MNCRVKTVGKQPTSAEMVQSPGGNGNGYGIVKGEQK